MPLLAVLWTAISAQMMGLVAFFLAKKVGVIVLVVAALATSAGALYLTMRGLIVPLASSLFSTSYGSIIGLAFPPVAGTCMLAISGTWIACGLYSWQRSAIKAIAA
jgi:hypothetical protein